MTQEALLDFCGSQARLVGDLIEPWKREHDTAAVAHALEKAIPSLIRGCELLEVIFPAVKNHLMHGQVGNILELGTKYYRDYLGWIENVEVLEGSAKDAIQEGFIIPEFSRLEVAVRSFRHFFEEEVERLPRIDRNMLERSAAEYERGDYQSAREFFDELRRRSD